MEVKDEIRRILPEIDLIGDPSLREKVVEKADGAPEHRHDGEGLAFIVAGDLGREVGHSPADLVGREKHSSGLGFLHACSPSSIGAHLSARGSWCNGG